MKNFTGVYELSNEDGSTITAALGITQEREAELKKKLPRIIQENDRVSQTLEAIWNEVDHPNEYAWMVFIYGANTGIEQAKKADFLKDLIDKFKKDFGDE